MAFEHSEAIWRPGRVHVGNEVETEVAAMFSAVGTGAVTEGDFSPRAALHPQNFAQGANVGAPLWTGHRVLIPDPASWLRLGGEYDCGMLRRSLTRFWVRTAQTLGAGLFTDMDAQLREVTEAGADNAVATISFNPNAVEAADVAVAGVTIARRSRLYVQVNANASARVLHITAGARLTRFWVN